MEHNSKNKKDLNRVDFISLKRKGLTKCKISKMIGIPIKETERRLSLQLDSRFLSGVF